MQLIKNKMKTCSLTSPSKHNMHMKQLSNNNSFKSNYFEMNDFRVHTFVAYNHPTAITKTNNSPRRKISSSSKSSTSSVSSCSFSTDRSMSSVRRSSEVPSLLKPLQLSEEELSQICQVYWRSIQSLELN